MRVLLLAGSIYWGLLAGGRPPAPPASPLTPPQVQRLVLFAQLAGSVRYFYPSQATSRADWQAVYTDAIPRLLQAPSTVAFGDSLRRVLAAVAPSVVLRASSASPLAPVLPAPGPLYRWEHRSLDLDKQGLGLAAVLMRLAHLPFASRLGLAPAAGAQLPATYSLPLGDSLVADIPLVLPAAQARVPIAFRRRARCFRVTQPAQRLALMMQAWSVLQQFYPYRDRLAQVGWAAALPAALRAAAAAQTDEALRVAGKELVARLGDRHVQLSRHTRTGLYITPPDFALAFELLPDGRAVVARAAGQWAASFPLGSILEQINGQPIGAVLDSLQRQTSAATGAAARQLAVHQLLRYYWHRAPAMQLAVRTEAGLHSQSVAFRELRLPPSRAGATRALPDSLVYLDAARLQYADFVRQLPALQRARGLIVDLRQRPAYGMQLALAHWASAPLQGDWLATPVLHAPNFAAATYDSARSTTAARLPHLATPTVFLIGPDTFSYGETLVELIRHYRLGLLLGQLTGGTNGEMNFVNVGNHYHLSWTGRRVCNRDGRPYQGQGIAPDVVVRPTLASIRRQEDAELQQAIAYLVASPRPGPPAPKTTVAVPE